MQKKSARKEWRTMQVTLSFQLHYDETKPSARGNIFLANPAVIFCRMTLPITYQKLA